MMPTLEMKPRTFLRLVSARRITCHKQKQLSYARSLNYFPRLGFITRYVISLSHLAAHLGQSLAYTSGEVHQGRGIATNEYPSSAAGRESALHSVVEER